uniref:HDC11024 n=1 Tax=Drosophila melanogaster TaxID=7227 RepID=Q6IKY6_DROME|nr:TPA_inf: HDC11024 [Drosophila melanogaster]
MLLLLLLLLCCCGMWMLLLLLRDAAGVDLGWGKKKPMLIPHATYQPTRILSRSFCVWAVRNGLGIQLQLQLQLHLHNHIHLRLRKLDEGC